MFDDQVSFDADAAFDEQAPVGGEWRFEDLFAGCDPLADMGFLPGLRPCGHEQVLAVGAAAPHRKPETAEDRVRLARSPAGAPVSRFPSLRR